MRRECRERFPRHRLQKKPLVSDHGMRHARAVMHVGIATSGGGENVPGIPGACATRNFTYLVRDPYVMMHIVFLSNVFLCWNEIVYSKHFIRSYYIDVVPILSFWANFPFPSLHIDRDKQIMSWYIVSWNAVLLKLTKWLFNVIATIAIWD